MEKNFNTRIKHKRDTSARWTTYNPVLKNGEMILVDTADGELRAKIGDGTKKYTQLPFTDETLRSLITDSVETKADKSQGIFYIEGTGDTAGTWLGTHGDITEYYAGLTIAYKVGIAGTSGLTLNINNLGAVSVVRNTTTAVTTHYGVGAIVFLVYTVDSDGTAYWKVSDYDSDTKTRSSNKAATKMYIIGAISQSNSGQTTYSNSKCYIGKDNCLYSNGIKVATAEDIPTYESSVFIAVYDETSLDDIITAVNSGKSVFCKMTEDGTTALIPLTHYNDEAAHFNLVYGVTTQITELTLWNYYIYVTSNGWDYDACDEESVIDFAVKGSDLTALETRISALETNLTEVENGSY